MHHDGPFVPGLRWVWELGHRVLLPTCSSKGFFQLPFPGPYFCVLLKQKHQMGSALDDIGFLKVRGFQSVSKSHTGNTSGIRWSEPGKTSFQLATFSKEIGDQLLEELRKQSWSSSFDGCWLHFWGVDDSDWQPSRWMFLYLIVIIRFLSCILITFRIFT